MRTTRATPTFLLLALALGLAGCGSDDAPPTGPDPEPPTDPVPTSIAVSPAELSLEALDATGQLQASVLDEDGNAIAGAPVTWSSEDAAVASVSSTGVVTAAAVGSTTVTATSGSLSGEASVTVTQIPAAVTVTPESAELLPRGSATYMASVADANGNAIPGAEVAWSTGDESVATVDAATGEVTAVAEGTTTVTGESGSASGTATVTVLAPPPDLEFTADGELGGAVNAGTVSIPAGVTVTLTEDLVLNTTGPVTIEGTLSGDCVAVDVSAGGDLTLTGATVSTACATPPAELPDLALESDGVIRATDATIRSGGALVLRAGEEPAAGAVPAGLRAFQDLPVEDATCELIRATLSGGKGKDGAAGGDAGDGGGVHVFCGTVRFEDLDLVGGDGGRGGDQTGEGPSPIVGGGNGGDGGRIVFGGGWRDGVLLSGTVRFEAGNGGRGGDATAAASQPGGRAAAFGGKGGQAGPVELDFSDGEPGIGGLFEVDLGMGGDGGNAVAIGAPGAPSGPGGDAEAVGGAGGGHAPLPIGPTMPGALLPGGAGPATLEKITVRPAVTGAGGDATASSGRGGDGESPGSPGGPGGTATAEGGVGGDFEYPREVAPPVSVTLGDGGDAVWSVGGGGNGAPDVCSAGGDGGRGGDAGGSGGGRPGRDVADALNISGAWGTSTIQTFGNGGDGADGTGGGMAGDPGSNAVELTEGNPESVVVVQPSFQPGEPGQDVDCATTMATDIQVREDRNGHNPFIQVTQIAQMILRLQLQALALVIDPAGVLPQLTGQLTAAAPTPGQAAQAATSYTFALSGTGTIVGISGVKVTFDGTLEVDADGRPVSMTGELVVDADNDKLPPDGSGQRNPAIYTVEGTPQ